MKNGKEKDQAYCQIMGFSKIDKNKFAVVGFLSDLFVYNLLFKIPNDNSVFISNNQDVLDEEHYLWYLLYSLVLVKQGGIDLSKAVKPRSTMVPVVEEEEGQEDQQDEKEANDETANVPQAQNLQLAVVNVQQEAEQTFGQNNLVISKAPLPLLYRQQHKRWRSNFLFRTYHRFHLYTIMSRVIENDVSP
jgi:hypothetical protein